MEPITPLAPPPLARPAQAEPARTDQTRTGQPRDRESTQSVETDTQIAFLAHLGAPVPPEAARHGADQTKVVPNPAPASATAMTRDAVLTGDADAGETGATMRAGEPAAVPPVAARATPAGAARMNSTPPESALPASPLLTPGRPDAATVDAAMPATRAQSTRVAVQSAAAVYSGGDMAGAPARVSGKAAPAPRSDVDFTLRYPAASPATDDGPVPAAPAVETAQPMTPRLTSPQTPGTVAPLQSVTSAAAAAPPAALPATVGDRTEPPAEAVRDGDLATQKEATTRTAAVPRTAPDAAVVKVADDGPVADVAEDAESLQTMPGDVAHGTHAAGRAPAPAVDRAIPGPALPPGLGHHLAEVAARFPDRPVELTLSPEELGRIRMTFTTGDGALTMNLVADRPDTLSLLRRHIDVLAQDFRDLGFANLSFSFTQGGRSPQPEAETITDTDPAAEAAPALAPRPRMTAKTASGGLDLRL